MSFQPWRSVDEQAGPSGLAELEQLCVKSNCEHGRHLDIAAPHAAGDKKLSRPGNKAKSVWDLQSLQS